MSTDWDIAKQNAADWEPAPMPDDWGRTISTGYVRRYVIPPEPQTHRSEVVIMLALLVALLIIAATVTAVSVSDAGAPTPTVPSAQVSEVLGYGDSGEAVKQLQVALVAAGWPTWVDGIFGPHTHKTVTLYQKANGLYVDGLAGPQTLGHLAIPGTVVPAIPPTPAPTVPVGPCSQWTSTAAAVGWPTERLEWLSGIMYRESRCQPWAHNGRNRDDSYGLLQMNTKDALWGELQRRCGLTSKGQLFDPATNLACGYKLYLAYGTKPWRVG